MAAAVLMEEELQHSMAYLRLPFFEHAANAWTFKAPHPFPSIPQVVVQS
jgi:hypothetical protein